MRVLVTTLLAIGLAGMLSAGCGGSKKGDTSKGQGSASKQKPSDSGGGW